MLSRRQANRQIAERFENIDAAITDLRNDLRKLYDHAHSLALAVNKLADLSRTTRERLDALEAKGAK